MTIGQDIAKWATQRPRWQRLILHALASGTPFDDAQLEALVDGLLDPLSKSDVQDLDLAMPESSDEQVQLVSLADCENVNALVKGQTLPFASSGLTVIYGDNGSGKSGYARLIKQMVDARHSSAVLPDVFADPGPEPAAILTYSLDGHEDQQKFPSVPALAVKKMRFYDEHCGDVYLRRESTVSYRPSALGLLDGLIAVCDRMQGMLQSRIRENQASALGLSLPQGTKAAAFVASLTEATSAIAIAAATKMPDNANDKLAKALNEEARLLASDANKERTRLLSVAAQVKTLESHVRQLNLALGADALLALKKSLQQAVDLRAAADLAAAGDFDAEPLPGVGAATWRALWAAARTYSMAEAYATSAFPVVHSEARCVLCQQILTADTADRLNRFQHFVTDTTARDARLAEEAHAAAVAEVRTLAVGGPSTTSSLLVLNAEDEALGKLTNALLTQLETHRVSVISWLEVGTPEPTCPAITLIAARLEALAKLLTEAAVKVDVAAFQTALAAATQSKLEIQSDIKMAEATTGIEAEVKRLQMS